MTDERAATEVMGYVLVIALVTILIGIVMTTGISGLESSQQGEQINNMERGFDVLSHNIEELTTGEAPSRATELRLADGSIQYGETTTINVTSDDDLVGNLSIVTEPIIYESESGVQIVYEAGGVIRAEDDRSVMLQDPPYVVNDDQVIIKAVRTRPMGGSNTEVDGPGTVLVRAENLGSNVEQNRSAGTINISIETQRVDAWESYFEEIGIEDMHHPESNKLEVTLETSADDVYIVRTRLRMELVD